jgi:HPt (histidine-containing phosphotransfer) domain-containing protein
MAKEEMEIINPPNTLKSKVKIGGPGAISPDMIEKAEQVLAGLSDNYLDWVQQDLKNISAAFEELKAGRGDQKKILDNIFRIAHDMKGQGGSFGYNLVTAVGNELCRMIEKMPSPIGPSHIDAIGVHIDSMKLVIAQKMKGDAGQAGAAMLAGLQKVSAKLTA